MADFIAAAIQLIPIEWNTKRVKRVAVNKLSKTTYELDLTIQGGTRVNLRKLTFSKPLSYFMSADADDSWGRKTLEEVSIVPFQ